MHILSTFDIITLLSTTHSNSLRRFPVPLVTTGIYIYIYSLEEGPPLGESMMEGCFSRVVLTFPMHASHRALGVHASPKTFPTGYYGAHPLGDHFLQMVLNVLWLPISEQFGCSW